FNRAMKSGDGSIVGRFRTRSRLRRTAVSCREQREQTARCCCIAIISTAGRTSSTNMTWLFRNWRQSIIGGYEVRTTSSARGYPATSDRFQNNPGPPQPRGTANGEKKASKAGLDLLAHVVSIVQWV